MNSAVKTVYEMIERIFGAAAKNWFTLEIRKADKDIDFFEIKAENDKIRVSANNGSALARGVYEYLKKFCRVQLSQTACNTSLPLKKSCLKKQYIRKLG